MDYKEVYARLISSELFKQWKGKNKGAYLAHLFGEADEKLSVLLWQVGYYDKKNDLITTFVVGDTIEHMPSAEVFKKEGIVEELELENVQVSDRDALRMAAEFQKKKYRQHPLVKGILILQHLDVGIVWNVTFITASFAALNIKIDARSGGILQDGLVTLFDLKAQ